MKQDIPEQSSITVEKQRKGKSRGRFEKEIIGRKSLAGVYSFKLKINLYFIKATTVSAAIFFFNFLYVIIFLGYGLKWDSGVRRSKRIKSRPLEYWRGERFLYGRIHKSEYLEFFCTMSNCLF